MKRDAWLSVHDEEMKLTRRCLERVPDSMLGWKPHAKSGTLGWLANFCAQLVSWTKMTLETDGFDFAESAKRPRPEALTSREAILALFDKNVAEGRAAIQAASDERFSGTWTMRNGEHVLVTSPREDVLRRWVLHHAIHHRGQLTVYLRLLDVPVPALYGPSADEVGW